MSELTKREINERGYSYYDLSTDDRDELTDYLMDNSDDYEEEDDDERD